MNKEVIKSCVYLPAKEFRLLGPQYELMSEILRLYTYYHYFKETFSKANHYWISDSQNSYYDTIILRWCMLFGSDREPTHFSLLCKTTTNLNKKMQSLGIGDVKTLNAYVLKDAELSKEFFKEYQRNTKDYRNQFLIRREIDSEKINDSDLFYPQTDILIKLTFSLFLLFKNVFNTYPSKKDQIHSQGIVFDQVNTLDEFVKLNEIVV